MTRCPPNPVDRRSEPRPSAIAASLIRGAARHPATRVAIGLACAALLAGCAGSPATRYHGLAALDGGAAAAYDGPPLEVGTVQMPPAFGRQELVREVGDGQFEVREFDHWAAPLGRLARQALAEDLARRLPAGKLVFPGAAWPAPGRVLSVDVLSFRTFAGSATMVASWSLRPVGSAAGGALPVRGAQIELRTTAGDGADATAQALSRLLGELADRVVAEIGTAAAR